MQKQVYTPRCHRGHELRRGAPALETREERERGTQLKPGPPKKRGFFKSKSKKKGKKKINRG